MNVPQKALNALCLTIGKIVPDDVQIVQPQFNTNQFYFTSGITEGVANFEEVVECQGKETIPDIIVRENQPDFLRIESKDVTEIGPIGHGVKLGHQLGQTSTVSHYIECTTESVAECGEEILIATKLENTGTVHGNKDSTSFETETEIVVHSELDVFKDYLHDDECIDLFFPIISSDSSDNDDPLLSDYKSEIANIYEGNIPDLECLGVDKVEKPIRKNLSERMSRSLSYPVTTPSISPVELLTSDSFNYALGNFSDGIGPSIGAYNLSPRKYKSAEVVKQKPMFCSTSVQSALVSKLHSKQLTRSNENIEKHLQEYDSINTWLNKSKGQFKDFDKRTSIASRDYHDAQSDMDKSMTSLLKEELKYKIQVERMKKGEPEVVLEPESPKTYQLRPDEIKKRTERLLQNRLSARRSRIKFNSHKRQLERTIKEEMSKTAVLRKEINHLVVYRDVLQKELDDHMKVCKRTRHNSL
ncbi:Cyclic AMP-dependent transcription factor ATF-3 [Mactra antiquata]